MSSSDLRRSLIRERWYRDQGKHIRDIAVLDRVPLGGGAELTFVKVRFRPKGSAIYVLSADEPRAASRLLELALGRKLTARALGGDHSNSCFLFGKSIVGKLSRKLESGPSVEAEILTALAGERKRLSIPELLGSFELGPATLMTFTRFISSRGDAFRAGEARLLGRRTAELHLALSAVRRRDFSPVPFSLARRRELARRIQESVIRTFARLPRERARPRVVANILSQLEARGAFGQLIRVHGDFHLGQLLRTKRDFHIIDFDGEPSRPLEERRRKRTPLADVAGMLRSFSYAGLGQRAASEYLAAYRRTLSRSAILPSGEREFRALLHACLLEKVSYEIGYELDHRPSWVRIPLAGFGELCDLVSRAR